MSVWFSDRMCFVVRVEGGGDTREYSEILEYYTRTRTRTFPEILVLVLELFQKYSTDLWTVDSCDVRLCGWGYTDFHYWDKRLEKRAITKMFTHQYSHCRVQTNRCRCNLCFTGRVHHPTRRNNNHTRTNDCCRYSYTGEWSSHSCDRLLTMQLPPSPGWQAMHTWQLYPVAKVHPQCWPLRRY